MRKVLYVVTSPSHKRAFESFVERPDLDQMVAGPPPLINEGIVPEDYSDFKIKKIKFYKGLKELQAIVDKFKPDVFVQASLPCAKGLKLPSGCKRVYVSHGMVGNHVKGMIKAAGFDTSVWKGCDLYCGVWDSVFSEWIKHTAKVDQDKILLDAMPQLDILHDKTYYESYRERVLKHTGNPNPDKVILFAGFCCKNRLDFAEHNENYFETVLALEKLAKKNNWLVMVKPRHTLDAMIKFLKSQKWGKKYVEPYHKIQTSKNLHFITTSGHIYRYFFADCIVVNGCSTIEIEAIVLRKPLVIVRTRSKDSYDPYNTVHYNASWKVEEDILENINTSVDVGIQYAPENKAYDELLSDMGITFDGKAHSRVQEALVKL